MFELNENVWIKHNGKRAGQGIIIKILSQPDGKIKYLVGFRDGIELAYEENELEVMSEEKEIIC